MRKAFIVMGIALLVLCFTASGALAAPVPKKVGQCLPEPGTDKGWNEQSRVSLEKVAKKYGFEIVLGEGLGYGDIKPTLRDMAKKGCELVILHASGYATAGYEIAHETGMKVLTAEGGLKIVTPCLVSDWGSFGGPGGYLAGVLAARMDRTNCVAMVSSAESNTACRLIAGFAQGVKDTKPGCKFIYNLVGQAAFGDAAGAKRNSEDAIAAGADVIFGHGDGASFGMLQACTLKKAKDGGKVWFIDFPGDKRDIDKADILLSSVIFDFSVLYDEVIQTIINGTFGRYHHCDVPSGGIYLLKPNKAVPQEVLDELEEVKRKIMACETIVIDKPVPADMHVYLDDLFPK